MQEGSKLIEKILDEDRIEKLRQLNRLKSELNKKVSSLPPFLQMKLLQLFPETPVSELEMSQDKLIKLYKTKLSRVNSMWAGIYSSIFLFIFCIVGGLIGLINLVWTVMGGAD